ncbi:MAG: hypothetical protein OXK80_01330 [Bdellovibrionales bacterium]|nr:hypothetical protein [Bdellovibrionales bacterium]
MKNFLVIAIVILCAGCSPDVELGYPLATLDDPPPGEETTPTEADVYLGRYKTCSAYAEYFKSKMGFFARVFIMSWAQYLQDFSTVECEVDHTCHCESDQYFAENFGGERNPIYRCIEPPSAEVEADEIYAPTGSFPNEGVIKFALPRSYCEK